MFVFLFVCLALLLQKSERKSDIFVYPEIFFSVNLIYKGALHVKVPRDILQKITVLGILISLPFSCCFLAIFRETSQIIRSNYFDSKRPWRLKCISKSYPVRMLVCFEFIQ